MTKYTILLIDDEQAIRTVLAAALSRAGYFVVEAANGQEAHEQFRMFSVDLIITDIIMPDVDGIEFIQEMAIRNSKVPVIAMSGGGMIPADAYLKMAKLSGAKAQFRKPFEVEELLACVRKILTPPEKS